MGGAATAVGSGAVGLAYRAFINRGEDGQDAVPGKPEPMRTQKPVQQKRSAPVRSQDQHQRPVRAQTPPQPKTKRDNKDSKESKGLGWWWLLIILAVLTIFGAVFYFFCMGDTDATTGEEYV